MSAKVPQKLILPVCSSGEQLLLLIYLQQTYLFCYNSKQSGQQRRSTSGINSVFLTSAFYSNSPSALRPTQTCTASNQIWSNQKTTTTSVAVSVGGAAGHKILHVNRATTSVLTFEEWSSPSNTLKIIMIFLLQCFVVVALISSWFARRF